MPSNLCEVFPVENSAKPTEVGVTATAVEASDWWRCLDDFFNDLSTAGKGPNPQTGGGLVREIRTKKNNGPKNMEVTDFIQYKLPQIDVRCSSFVHQNLRFFPRNKKFGLLQRLWGAHHHPTIWGLIRLPYFLGPGGMGEGGVSTPFVQMTRHQQKEMFCGDSYENYPKSWEGLRESQHICIYHIYIYVYQAYTLYIIYIFCIYICIERFQESRSLYVQYICSTMLEGLQKELQWVFKSAL